MAVLILGDILDPDARAALAHLQHHGGVPALDVARDLGPGQRGAPGLFPALKLGGVDRVDGPRQRPWSRSKLSSARRSARSATRCRSSSIEARTA
jgi:hypothetical protein